MTEPILSYTVWFSQRTGSTLLCKALEETGIAGKPNEWLYLAGEEDLVEFYHVSNPTELQKHLWEIGSTPNSVFGLKHGLYEPNFTRLLSLMRQFPGCPEKPSRGVIWQNAFPNCRHIFMTRRNKVRLAVSWWKAIKSQEWHRKTGETPKAVDLEGEYLYEAILQLFHESAMREAGMQEFFSEARIAPLTIVYEDFILDYEQTVRNVLDYLGIDPTVKIIEPYYERLADEVSDAWAERFRQELQSDWDNCGW